METLGRIASFTVDWKGVSLCFCVIGMAWSLASNWATHKPEVVSQTAPAVQVAIPQKTVATNGGCSIFYVEFEGQRYLCNSAGGIVSLQNAPPTLQESNVRPTASPEVIKPTKSAPAAPPSPEGLGSGTKPVIELHRDDHKTTQILMGQSGDEWPVQ